MTLDLNGLRILEDGVLAVFNCTNRNIVIPGFESTTPPCGIDLFNPDELRFLLNITRDGSAERLLLVTDDPIEHKNAISEEHLVYFLEQRESRYDFFDVLISERQSAIRGQLRQSGTAIDLWYGISLGRNKGQTAYVANEEYLADRASRFGYELQKDFIRIPTVECFDLLMSFLDSNPGHIFDAFRSDLDILALDRKYLAQELEKFDAALDSGLDLALIAENMLPLDDDWYERESGELEYRLMQVLQRA